MNIELLNEIRKLRDEKLSDTDIASSLGISKQNILLMLRIESVVRKDLEDITFSQDDKIKSISIIQKDLDDKNLEILELKNIIDDLKSNDVFLKYEEMKIELDILKKENDDLEDSYINLEDKFNSMPDYLKKLFLKK